MVMMDIVQFWPVVGLPLVRNVSGWLKNSLDDGFISPYEWGQLGSTLLDIGVPALVIFGGFNAAGMDVPLLAATAGVWFANWITGKLSPQT